MQDGSRQRRPRVAALVTATRRRVEFQTLEAGLSEF